jgi:palmitoyltransferase ZDHHC9/14/18
MAVAQQVRAEFDSIPEHMASQPLPSTLKVWQAWPGRHTFCCDGRVMVGPDFGVTVFAATLTTGTCVTFWVFVCTSLPVPAFVVGAVLFLMTMVFLVLTATTDPGIVPSNRGMEQAEIDACAQAQRTVEINGVTIQLKWCRTCHIFRPPRAAHCSECNVCVERFDHHCPWMGQCIGRRNYRFFLGFVNSCCLLCSYTLGLTCVFIYRVATMDGVKHGDFFSHAMARAPAGVAIVAFCALILLCVGPLACYHYSLVCSNKTTSEEIKELYTQNNPFDRGVCGNCNEACCVAIEAPRLQPRALVTEPLETGREGLIDASLRDANAGFTSTSESYDGSPDGLEACSPEPDEERDDAPARHAFTRVVPSESKGIN